MTKEFGEIRVLEDLVIIPSGVWFMVNMKPYEEQHSYWVSVIDYEAEAAFNAVKEIYGPDTVILAYTVGGGSDEWEKAVKSETNPFADVSLSGLEL